MLTTSQDILYITIAACAAVFTIFLVWIMYYIAQISKQSNEMISDFRAKMTELDETLQTIKDKVTDSGEKILSIMDFIKNFSGSRRRGRRS